MGGLEHSGVIEVVANWMMPFMQQNLLVGNTVLYWVSAAICGVVQHDAYILSLLYVIRDVAANTDLNPWPMYWNLVWAGTLGSNLTIAGAPALFVAVNLGEKEEQRKVPLKEFLSYTAKYVVLSLVICYVISMLLWVLPFM